MNHRVYLDGEDLSKRTMQARRGYPGMVVLHAEGPDGGAYRCPCGKGPAEVVLGRNLLLGVPVLGDLVVVSLGHRWWPRKSLKIVH